VDGEVEGPIKLPGQRLTVRPDGRIRGNIEARHVVLHGLVEGDIQASDRVELDERFRNPGANLLSHLQIPIVLEPVTDRA
jgi:cytoskeletal protein CcmA (bactofilin family)